MPSKKQYNLVQNDDYDTRIPLHSEEAFQHGIAFQAKYIGTLDVPRPTSRVEIVAAMRRIRYEFKAKGIKKKKVTVEVSVDGVRVTLRKKKKKKPWMDESSMVLMQHPVYRIFYVSHDSQDLKIFSYIARDGATNVFKCNVFKSNKKSQAMRVVRTVGQAFEVCHKLSVGGPPDDETTTADIAPSESHSDLLSDKPRKGVFAEGPASSADALAAAESLSTLDAGASDSLSARQRPLHLDIIPPPPNTHPTRRSPLSGGETYASPLSDLLKQSADASLPSAGTPLSAHHELQLMREQLEQQNQQTQAAVAQVHLLRDQLAAETAARLEAQARTHQLLVHNKELLDHISALVAHLQETERLQQQQHHQQQQQQQQQHVTSVPQSQMLDPQTPSLYLQDYPDLEALRQLTHGRLGQPYLQTGVPGSPHQQRNLFPNMFGLGLADQQFQNQLMQRLQNINTPYRQSQFYPDVGGLYSQQNTQTQSSPQFNLRVSQASSFTGSPVLSHRKDSEDDSPFIRPLSQVGTYTTTDTDGRTRVLVGSEEEQKEALRLDPPPSGVKKKEPALSGKRHDPLAAAMSSLRVSPEDDDIRRPASGAFHNGPFITRSTSEKVPNRSELMSQVQRTAWARHTTK